MGTFLPLVAASKLLVVACGHPVPWPGIEPGCPAFATWSLSHWTIREIPALNFFHHSLSFFPAHYRFVVAVLVSMSVFIFSVASLPGQSWRDQVWSWRRWISHLAIPARLLKQTPFPSTPTPLPPSKTPFNVYLTRNKNSMVFESLTSSGLFQ